MSFKHYPLAALVTIFVVLFLAPPAAATSHSTGSTLIEVRATGGETLSESLAEKIKAVAGVSRVEKYLLIRGEQNDKIGVEAGAALRIFTKDGDLIEGRAEFGRAFRDADASRNVALVNRVTYAAQGMAGMVHYLGVGQTFTLQESRIRIIGEVAAPTSHKIFLPLETAQRLYGKEGLLTHIFVQVQDAGRTEGVREALEESFGVAATIRP